ncbi:hypothetical protein D9756_009572 [Leucocoprinus leucothites]|uniref:GST N-terminal domain-containing protein n=1 Tax=Leucocoprinus leucothites TaxID=201217 RepID=A0A8H5FTH6_9AGAR|nr:hypothetical protein D9756_009572 [Leucoagaricus leucothites]
MITFYDLAAKDGIQTWSPNPWKTRYVLNYKKLPYKTVRLEYPDIESEYKKLGIPPSGINFDGTSLYTSPSIIDEATKTPVTDSYKIAEYLDKAYPNTPPVFPPGTEVFQAAFYDQVNELIGPLWPLLLPRIPRNLLNPPSAEYFTRTRSVLFGMPLSHAEPQGEKKIEAWQRVQVVFEIINGWLSKSSGPYFMGDTVTFSDFVIAALLDGIRICFGEESKEWKNVQTWNDGRWKTFLTSLEKYANVEN